jgi:hypothetical protein
VGGDGGKIFDLLINFRSVLHTQVPCEPPIFEISRNSFNLEKSMPKVLLIAKIYSVMKTVYGQERRAAHVLEVCSVSMSLHQDHFKSQAKQFHFKAKRSVAKFRNSTSRTLPLRKIVKKRMKMMKTFHHSYHHHS